MERITLYKMRAKELLIEENWRERQRSRETPESERQLTTAAQVKFFGNMLKNATPKLPADAVDIPICFGGVGNLFDSFVVRAKPLLPHMSEKASSVLLQ